MVFAATITEYFKLGIPLSFIAMVLIVVTVMMWMLIGAIVQWIKSPGGFREGLKEFSTTALAILAVTCLFFALLFGVCVGLGSIAYHTFGARIHENNNNSTVSTQTVNSVVSPVK